MKKLVYIYIYITNNIAPFRVMLLDELAKSVDVTLMYVTETDATKGKDYLSRRPKVAKRWNIVDNGISGSFRRIKDADYVIFDGYTGAEKMKLLFKCILNKVPYSISVDGLIRTNDNFLKDKLKGFFLKNSLTVFSNDVITDRILKSYAKNVKISRNYFTTLYQEDK